MISRFMIAVLLLTLGSGLSFALDLDIPLDRPQAIALDRFGSLWILESSGVVTEVDARRRGVLSSRVLPLSGASDIARDVNGNLAVADSARHRLAVFATDGRLLRSVSFPATTRVERLAISSHGELIVLTHNEHGARLRRFDARYRELSSFDVTAPCPDNPLASAELDLAVDRHDDLWIAERTGCGEDYRLRKYDSGGALLGSWQRASGQFDARTIATTPHTLLLVADIFTDGNELFVILGATSETGTLEVDVWNLSGSLLRRSELRGPGAPMVRAVAYDGEVFVADTLGKQRISVVASTDL